jgi:hypothetical protein
MKDNVIYPETFGWEVYLPESLRCFADKVERGEMKELAITMLEGDEGSGIISCDLERADVLIAAVVEHMKDWLNSHRTMTH